METEELCSTSPPSGLRERLRLGVFKVVLAAFYLSIVWGVLAVVLVCTVREPPACLRLLFLKSSQVRAFEVSGKPPQQGEHQSFGVWVVMMVLPVYLYFSYAGAPENRFGRRSERFCNLRLFGLSETMFGLHRDGKPLAPSKKYIFCLHPHGALCINRLAFSLSTVSPRAARHSTRPERPARESVSWHQAARHVVICAARHPVSEGCVIVHTKFRTTFV